MQHIWFHKTPVGALTIIEKDETLVRVSFGIIAVPNDNIEKKTALIKETLRQLDDFFARKRKVFNLPITFIGTPFQQKVWHALQTIPYGETKSYKEIAVLVGKPAAARAVGSANHHNPVAIIVPCHRVIGSDGSLTGYAGGLKIKQYLLDLERNEP